MSWRAAALVRTYATSRTSRLLFTPVTSVRPFSSAFRSIVNAHDRQPAACGRGGIPSKALFSSSTAQLEETPDSSAAIAPEETSASPAPAADLAEVRAVTFVPRPPKLPKQSLEAALAKISAGLKWDQTYELVLRVSTYDKAKKKGKARDAFRGMVLMPNPFRPPKNVVVFASGPEADVARQAGAAEVGGREIVAGIMDGSIKADVLLATANIIKSLKPEARHLRQRMPSVKKGSVSDDIESLINEHMRGVQYKMDPNGYVGIGIGKMSFDDALVRENIESVIDAVKKHSLSEKQKFILGATLSCTQGKGVELDLEHFDLM